MGDATPDVRLRLTPDDTAHLPLRIARLVRDVSVGAHVVVDVTSAQPQPAGLGLLLSVLWRRVGAGGQVDITGATQAELLRWGRLGLTPDHVRVAVHGTAQTARDAGPVAIPSPPRQRTPLPDRALVPSAP